MIRRPSSLALLIGVGLTTLLPTCSVAAEPEFARTRVIGFSQVGQPRGGWFVAGGVFESIVDDDRWELLWHGGAGVDRWRNPDYVGWSRPLVSACPTDVPPDRVVLVISGPFGDDEAQWETAIRDTLATIAAKLPSVRHVVLQPVVGGPEGQPCPAPDGSGRAVRASQQQPHIVNAIQRVVATPDLAGVDVSLGYVPQLDDCAGFADRLGHLTPEAARAVAARVARYYQPSLPRSR